MPWGVHSEDDNTKNLNKAQKKTYNKAVTEISQEAKRRVQQVRKAGKYDGNGKENR